MAARHLRRARLWLAFFIAGLVFSGVTAFPLQSEIRWLVGILHEPPLQQVASANSLLRWLDQVNEAVSATNAHYPFLAYGTDWLAFAHLVIAIVFIGPWIDPVRNKWVIHFGLIAGGFHTGRVDKLEVKGGIRKEKQAHPPPARVQLPLRHRASPEPSCRRVPGCRSPVHPSPAAQPCHRSQFYPHT